MTQKIRRDICAIIPCYNEGHSIGRIVRSVREYVETVIVVDDISKAAGAILAQAKAELARLQ